MKRLLKIKFSGGAKFPVRVRAVRLPALPGSPARGMVLVILPDGKIVRLPNPLASLPKNLPRRGSSALAVLPPCSRVPGCAFARRPRRGK